MLVPVLLFIVGLLFLIKGGDWFVDGASALARRFHLPELLIGATVVSIGTTLPEVMVSTMSAVSGHGEIAYGNAIGSVICNSALMSAAMTRTRPADRTLRFIILSLARWTCPNNRPTYGNTAQFPPSGLSTASAAAALRIMRYCPIRHKS